MINWTPGDTIESVEKECILQALRFYRGNKTQTSISLGISIRTLDNKLEKYENDQKRNEEIAAERRIKETEILNRLRYGTAAQPPANGLEAAARIHMESTAQIKPQHPVPVPERAQVQEVLQRNIAAGSKHRGR